MAATLSTYKEQWPIRMDRQKESSEIECDHTMMWWRWISALHKVFTEWMLLKFHGISKINFALVGNRKNCLQSSLFQWNQIMGLFISQDTVSMAIQFIAPGTLCLPKCQFDSTPWIVFFLTHVLCGKPMFTPFINTFWLKIASLYSLHINLQISRVLSFWVICVHFKIPKSFLDFIF